MTDTARPWVLVRKGKPVMRFVTREDAQGFYDALRFNAGVIPDGALFGPDGEAWYCRGTRHAQWERDDDRRRREREITDGAAV